MVNMRRCINTRASMADFPEEITVEILRRLPIKGIVMCKLTCKRWYDLISSTYFAKVHFAHARPCVLVENVNPQQYSRTLHLIEAREINPKCCSCDRIIGCGDHQVNMKLDTELKIPVIIKDKEKDKYAGAKSECVIMGLRSLKYKLFVMNSCNGFICLADGNNSNPMVVCNPVTNEYAELPETNDVQQFRMFGGLGFCEETNEYKVVRARGDDKMGEIHTLGTKSWKSIGFAPLLQSFFTHPIYLNGVLYWISDKPRGSFLLSFDCRNECFGGSFPSPPISPQSSTCLGIIGNHICLFANTPRGLTEIWIMEELLSSNGVIWSKLTSLVSPGHYLQYSRFGSISCSKCLAFPILYHMASKLMKCYDPKKKEWKKLRFQGKGFLPYIIIHTPSFSSLKHVTGANTKPISTWFKLRGEGTPFFLKG